MKNTLKNRNLSFGRGFRAWVFQSIFLAVLLCGCAVQAAHQEDMEAAAKAANVEEGPLYDSQSALERKTGGAIRVYPLRGESCCGLYPMGEDLLVLTGRESGCTLIRYSGDELTETARREIGARTVRVTSEEVRYYDGSCVVALDGALQEIRRVAVPEDAVGTPLLTAKGDALYYCTDSALRRLETETGISRVVRRLSAPGVTVRELLLEDTVVQCGCEDENLGQRYLFFSAATGETLWEGSGELTVKTGQGRYYASFPDGAAPVLLFGTPGEEPQTLLPEPGTDCVFAPAADATITLTQSRDGRAMTLGYLDLSGEMRSGSLTLPTEGYPWYITASRAGTVWFVLYDPEYGSDVICRWEPELSGTDCYVGKYYSPGNPDLEGLAQCGELAETIGERYGIHVRIWEDAVYQPPWDYRLEPEYRAELITWQLQQLDGWLGRYPEGFLSSLCGELELCLVRSITGSPESGSVEAASGIQFWEGTDARIVLAMGAGCERALYHELCHIIDSRVLVQSNAYDQWDQLNPGDFEYDYDYEKNKLRRDYQFLQEHSRSFVDMYSMSFPKEDRARIMEYAMTEGNEALFRCPILQTKLKTLCLGIREAFGLQKYPQALAWEAYLWAPLFPQTGE